MDQVNENQNVGDADRDRETEQRVLPCPFCRTIPVEEQSLQPRWFYIKHGEYCVLALNEFGRGRIQYLERRFLNAWNRRPASQ